MVCHLSERLTRLPVSQQQKEKKKGGGAIVSVYGTVHIQIPN